MVLENKVNGYSYSSNPVKLLKNLDTLLQIQKGPPNAAMPVMIHIAPTGNCNLTCSYCCCADRDNGEVLGEDKVISALKQFRKLGVKGAEWTGGGDPSLYKSLGKVVAEAADLGYKQGLITNGVKSPYLPYKEWSQLDWTRISFHAFRELPTKGEAILQKTVDNVREYAPNVDISSAFIWTPGCEEYLQTAVLFAEKNKIPTRITPDLTVGPKEIEAAWPFVRAMVNRHSPEYSFVSDFATKTSRRDDNCFMHMVKPYIYMDGNVYVCPSAELSPENPLTVSPEFKVCSIDDIAETYSKGAGGVRAHGCGFCKYAMANELIGDITRDVKHKDFA